MGASSDPNTQAAGYVSVPHKNIVPSRCRVRYYAGVGNLERRTGWQKREGDNYEGKDQDQGRQHDMVLSSEHGRQ